MEIRKIKKIEMKDAIDLVWKIFLEFEAPDYTEEGILEFKKSINNTEWIQSIEFFGAFENEKIVGVIATKNRNHIALFFVDSKYHKQGIGRKLYNKVLEINKGGYFTVNSSPFARDVYMHLGFKYTDDMQEVNGLKFFPMKSIVF